MSPFDSSSVLGLWRSERTARLTFSSFRGGGPVYSLIIGDPSIVSCSKSTSHGILNRNAKGTGYDVTFKLKGLRPGKTEAKVSFRSPCAGNGDIFYLVSVEEDLTTFAEKIREEDVRG